LQTSNTLKTSASLLSPDYGKRDFICGVLRERESWPWARKLAKGGTPVGSGFGWERGGRVGGRGQVGGRFPWRETSAPAKRPGGYEQDGSERGRKAALLGGLNRGESGNRGGAGGAGGPGGNDGGPAARGGGRVAGFRAGAMGGGAERRQGMQTNTRAEMISFCRWLSFLAERPNGGAGAGWAFLNGKRIESPFRWRNETGEQGAFRKLITRSGRAIKNAENGNQVFLAGGLMAAVCRAYATGV